MHVYPLELVEGRVEDGSELLIIGQQQKALGQEVELALRVQRKYYWVQLLGRVPANSQRLLHRRPPLLLVPTKYIVGFLSECAAGRFVVEPELEVVWQEKRSVLVEVQRQR